MSAPTELAYAELLAHVDIFSDLDRVTLAKLAARLEPVVVARGTVVVREGDPGDAFYLVARGSFGVFAPGLDGAADTRLASLGSGAPFGEMALLTNQPRSATIRADTDGEVLRLERSHFLDLVRREPGVALAIAATLSRRLAATQRPTPTVGSPASVAPARASTPGDRPGRTPQPIWRRWPTRRTLGGPLPRPPPPFRTPLRSFAPWRCASGRRIVDLMRLRTIWGDPRPGDTMPESASVIPRFS